MREPSLRGDEPGTGNAPDTKQGRHFLNASGKKPDGFLDGRKKCSFDKDGKPLVGVAPAQFICNKRIFTVM